MKALKNTLIAIALASLLGCGTSSSDAKKAAVDQAEQEALRARIESYAPVLAEAYSTGNIEVLREFAVERVLAQVEKRVSDLATSGMLVEPTMTDLIVEKVETFGNNFALVTTLETWDLRYYSTGVAHSLVSERLATRNRVEYQMKILDDQWMIFFRELKQEFDET